MQLQVRFGGNNPVTELGMNYYNPKYLGEARLTPSAFVLYNGNVPFAQARAKYGLVAKVLPAYGVRKNVRCQEWLIPWRIWGGPNGAALKKPVPGTRLGFTFGYNDKDAKEEPMPSLFRWRNAADPYSMGITSMATNTSIDAWGDLECSVALPEGKATAGISRTKHSTGAHPH
jgi:hypothetical protein